MLIIGLSQIKKKKITTLKPQMDLLSTNITPIWTVWNLQNEKGERWRRMKGLSEESGESKKLKLKI